MKWTWKNSLPWTLLLMADGWASCNEIVPHQHLRSETQRITTSTVPTPSGKFPFSIVHLGDSFSAGNGARDPDGDESWYGPTLCYRSPYNWGEQLKKSLEDVFTVNYINGACNGASTRHIWQELEWPRTFGAFNVPPQKRSINKGVNLVLMTFGGNDSGGFLDIVVNCFVKGKRTATGCRLAIEDARAALPQMQNDLISGLHLIGDQLNTDARVVLVAYPHLVTNKFFVLEDDDDKIQLDTSIRELGLEMDKYQRAAVDAVNKDAGRNFVVYFDSTKELFEGHEPDPSTEARNEARWLSEFEGPDPFEWYHLNAEGHKQLGQALSAFIRAENVQPGAFKNDKTIDLAFVVDTTGSMFREIGAVRVNLRDIVSNLASVTADFQVAVVSYRDFPERCPGDYAARVDQPFTNDVELIQAGINALQTGDGCDWRESVYSGIKAALDLSWTDGATKSMIVIGDAPPLLDDSGAELISGITAASVISASIALDPVAITGADISGSLNQGGFMGDIANATGGSIITSGDVVATVGKIVNDTAAKPFAWLGVSYVGKIGEPIVFDASGSYDTSGESLVAYEWDFEADGTFEESTATPTTRHTYATNFAGLVIVRVKSKTNRSALASALVVVNANGTMEMINTTCAKDSDGFSIMIDEETGSFMNCLADDLPTEDLPGIKEKTCASGPFVCMILRLIRFICNPFTKKLA